MWIKTKKGLTWNLPDCMKFGGFHNERQLAKTKSMTQNWDIIYWENIDRKRNIFSDTRSSLTMLGRRTFRMKGPIKVSGESGGQIKAHPLSANHIHKIRLLTVQCKYSRILSLLKWVKQSSVSIDTNGFYCIFQSSHSSMYEPDRVFLWQPS